MHAIYKCSNGDGAINDRMIPKYLLILQQEDSRLLIQCMIRSSSTIKASMHTIHDTSKINDNIQEDTTT